MKHTKISKRDNFLGAMLVILGLVITGIIIGVKCF